MGGSVGACIVAHKADKATGDRGGTCKELTCGWRLRVVSGRGGGYHRAVIFERQKRLLALLDVLGGRIGNLDFQKLLFLYCQEAGEAPAYEFVPYRYGGFSFTSYEDKRHLSERGLLEDEEKSWRLTDAGRAAATVLGPVRAGMETFSRRFAGLRGDALVAEAYRRHPYHAIRSEVAERVLAGDTAAKAAIASARPAPSRPGVCTLGYEGRSLEAYLNCLIRRGVTALCDVRRNPLSRKYGFSKGTLSKASQGVGIRYEHLPELGIASEERRGLKTQADYEALFEKYERDWLPRQTAALARIRGFVDSGDRVALTCFERLPEQCHRKIVAAALEKSFGRAFAPEHI